MAKAENSSGNVLLDNPGISAAILALLALLAFGGALYNTATSHHESSHGGEHEAAPAGEAPKH